MNPCHLFKESAVKRIASVIRVSPLMLLCFNCH